MKNYVKPELFYERYELSQHIADCAWEVNYENEEVCVLVADPELFMSETLFSGDRCGLDISDYEGFCYQSGMDGFNSFIS